LTPKSLGSSNKLVRRRQTWYQPDTGAEYVGIPIPFDEAVQAPYWQDDLVQQARSIAQRWYQPEDPTEGLVPPEVPFDPAPFAGAYQADTSIIPESRWLPPPELPWDGFEPIPFDPAIQGPHPQPEVEYPWLGLRWFQPDDDWLGQPPSEPAFDPAPFAGAYQADLTVIPEARWAVPAEQAEGLLPITFDADIQGPHSQPEIEVPFLAVRWYQPEDDWSGFVPPLVAFDPSAYGLWQEQPGQERSIAQLWYQPEDAGEGLEPPFVPPPVEPLPPPMSSTLGGAISDRLLARTHIWYQDDGWHAPVLPFDPAIQSPFWQPDLSLQDRPNQPTWYQPEDDQTGFVPEEAAFDPAPFSGAYQADLAGERWLVVRWYTPEQAEGLVPIPFGTEEQGGLYAEQPGQDRWLQPVWAHPDDDWLGQPPAEAAFDPAPMAGAYQTDTILAAPRWAVTLDTEAGPLVNPEALLAGLWPEQVAYWRPQIWFIEPDAAEGLLPPIQPEQFAALWQEQPGQDRFLQPVWWHPEQQNDPRTAVIVLIAIDPPDARLGTGGGPDASSAWATGPSAALGSGGGAGASGTIDGGPDARLGQGGGPDTE
jgi:hypothetical protein